MSKTTGLERKRTRFRDEEEIDEALVLWFMEQRGITAPLTGPIMKTKAKILEKMIEDDPNWKFPTRDGWFWRWQKRHGTGQLSIHGEKRYTDCDSVECFC